MYSNKYLAIFFTFLLLSAGNGYAQLTKTTVSPKRIRQYALVAYLGGGLARYASEINTQGERKDAQRNFLDGTIRLMWHPNHRLRVGFETGYSNFYSYRITDSNNTTGKVNLKAIPLLVVWSVPIVKRVNLFAGFGSYYLTTHLNYKGTVNSSAFSLGSLVAVNYIQPITKKIAVAAEVKWKNAFQTRDAQLGLQVQMVWKFLTY